MKTNNFNVTIQVKNIPSEDEESVGLELFDILKALNQLPYDFEVNMMRCGRWL